jgi:limonene-1,2-epoxide hydrolase
MRMTEGGTMDDRVNDALSHWTSAMEEELVVRDFLSNLGNRDATQLEPFLSPDVVYEPSARARVRGRQNVTRMCQDIFDGFETYAITPKNVAVCGRVVLVEQTLRLGIEGMPVYDLLSFASFEIVDFQIVAWRQLHG